MKSRTAVLLILFGAVVSLGWQEAASRKGEILVSNSSLVDPNFVHTAILLLEDTDEGAVGLVLNRQGGSVKRSRLYSALGLGVDPEDGEAEVPVFWGGPVQRDKMFILHSTDVTTEESQRITADVAMTDVSRMLKMIALGEGPEKYRLFMGYAGWGPGQLDLEMTVSSWIVVPGRTELVFPESPDSLWQRIMEEFTMRL